MGIIPIVNDIMQDWYWKNCTFCPIIDKENNFCVEGEEETKGSDSSFCVFVWLDALGIIFIAKMAAAIGGGI